MESDRSSEMTDQHTARPPRQVLVLTYWSYSDALIQAYTLPYVRLILNALPKGSTVHLITLEKGGGPSTVPSESGVVAHPIRYAPFGVRAAPMVLRVLWQGVRLIRRVRVDTIHAWCTPAGMMGHILSVLTGRPLILDSYEPHAEAMVENGTWRRFGLAFKVLFQWEKWQSRRAKVLIAAAAGMREYAARKYGVKDKPFHVKPACVDLEAFSLKLRKDPGLLKELGLEGRLVLVYAGKFGGIYLDQEVFDLFAVARRYWGERLQVLLLTGHELEDVMPFMTRAGLDPAMFTIRFVPHADMPRYMGLGDVAVTPVRSVPTKRYCTPIKDGEYWALGLPVIITPDISDDSRIIAENGIGAVLEGLNVVAYEKAVRTIDHLLTSVENKELTERIRAVAVRYRSLGVAEHIYRTIYGQQG